MTGRVAISDVVPVTFRVDAWGDPWTTWHNVEVKVGAGQGAHELANDLETGARLLTQVAERPERRADAPPLREAAERLRDAARAGRPRAGTPPCSSCARCASTTSTTTRSSPTPRPTQATVTR